MTITHNLLLGPAHLRRGEYWTQDGMVNSPKPQ